MPDVGLPDDQDRHRLGSALRQLAGRGKLDPKYVVPVIARTERDRVKLEPLGEFSTMEVRRDAPGARTTFLWGRLSVCDLVEYMADNDGLPFDREMIDLATPFSPAVSKTASATCQSHMSRTASLQTRKATAIIVDCGVSAPGAPDTYGGSLVQLVTRNIAMSPHAEQVLATLLDELDQLGVLTDVHVACSLVTPPPSVFGLNVLEQHNCKELVDALKEVQRYLAHTNTTGEAAINISMGTHVGPHTGISPLEQLVSALVDETRGVYIATSVGNDGERGVHAGRYVDTTGPEVLRLQTSTAGSQELLAEFWWQDRGGVDLTVTVEVLDDQGQMVFTGNHVVASATSPASMSRGNRRRMQHSLVGAAPATNLRCISYGLSSSNKQDLACLDIRFILEATSDLYVHAWLIGSEDTKTTFVPCYQTGTVTIPATAADVIGVGGLDDHRRPWSQSSRGFYKGFWQQVYTPAVAHLAKFGAGTDWGTSFAAPRVCAAALKALLHPARHQRCASVDDVIEELLGRPPGQWNPRVGFGAI
jgi:hypothetical protein